MLMCECPKIGFWWISASVQEVYGKPQRRPGGWWGPMPCYRFCHNSSEFCCCGCFELYLTLSMRRLCPKMPTSVPNKSAKSTSNHAVAGCHPRAPAVITYPNPRSGLPTYGASFTAKTPEFQPFLASGLLGIQLFDRFGELAHGSVGYHALNSGPNCTVPSATCMAGLCQDSRVLQFFKSTGTCVDVFFPL